MAWILIDIMDHFLILIGAFLAILSPVFVYPRRFNVLYWVGVPFFFVAFLAPLLVYDLADFFPISIIQKYAWITFVGGFFSLLGTFLGYRVVLLNYPLISRMTTFQSKHDLLVSRSVNIIIAGIVGILLSYSLMGFIPALADDPLNAKFFRGAYQQAYDRVAILYRSAYMCLMFSTPLVFSFYLQSKRRILLLYSIVASCLVLLSLTRGALASLIFTSWLVYVGFFNRRMFFPSLLLYFFVYVLGSSVWILLGIFEPPSYSDDYISFVLKIIASGAPDLFDQLNFLASFESQNYPLTWGRTFFGGLVPFRYEWNPSVYTLVVSNGGGDISDIMSGGFRLSTALWGYTSFSWLGVVIIPLLSGFFIGQSIKLIKKSTVHGYYSIILAITLCQTTLSPFVNFYNISLYMLPGILLVVYLTAKPKAVNFDKVS